MKKMATMLLGALTLVLCAALLFAAPVHASEDEEIPVLMAVTVRGNDAHGWSRPVSGARAYFYNELGEQVSMVYTDFGGITQGVRVFFHCRSTPPVFTIRIEAEGFETLTQPITFMISTTLGGEDRWRAHPSVINLTRLPSDVAPTPTPQPTPRPEPTPSPQYVVDAVDRIREMDAVVRVRQSVNGELLPIPGVEVVIYIDDLPPVTVTTNDRGNAPHFLGSGRIPIPVVYARISRADGFQFGSERLRLNTIVIDVAGVPLVELRGTWVLEPIEPEPEPTPIPQPTPVPTPQPENGIIINGEQIDTGDNSPFIMNNRMMVPLRIFIDQFGARAYWSSENQNAVIILDGVILRFQIGDPMVTITIEGVGQQQIDLGQSAMLHNNLTWVPLRSIEHLFPGVTVEWDPENRNAVITTS